LWWRDPACPKGIWSFGPWYTNTMKNLETGLALPEAHLYPHYRKQLANGKNNIIRLFECAANILKQDKLPEEVTVAEFSGVAHVNAAQMGSFFPEVTVLDAGAIASGTAHYHRHPRHQQPFEIDAVPLEAIICHKWAAFYAAREEIDNIIEIAKRL